MGFDRYASILFIALGVALFFYSQTLTSSFTGTSIGPKELPLFLAVALVITAVINLVAALRVKSPGGKKGLDNWKFLIMVGLLLLYVFLLEPLGYVISTFLFLMAAFQTMERGGYLKSALIAGAFSGGIYLLYVKVALGVLPGLPFGD
ncbi:MAG: tripartite tricarboxylate transporter TctB family protein [Planctomycetes bacterium]|jgi:putative tricarboxylic transport membrane protein|nr:tripartite tricarboxylate transporter TctB family protein [Planctomycetota bacterium]